MTPEARVKKLQRNSDAIDRWHKKLFRAANELQKLTQQRKRLLQIKTNRIIPDYGFDDDIPL